MITPGDMLLSGPVSWQAANLAQKGILLTGAHHTHDEIIAFNQWGHLCVGNAHVPHYTLDPFDVRLDEVKSRDRIMAVYRWNGPQDKNLGEQVSVCARLLADLQVPYDIEGIKSHAFNYFRKYARKVLPFLKDLTRHVEYKVYCTESVFKIMQVCGIYLNNYCGNQPLPAPIHMEQLIKLGALELVMDWGLHDKIEKTLDRRP